METVARSIALGQGLHTLLPVGAVGLGCGGLLLPSSKPLATLAVNGGTQSNIIGSSTSILGKRPLAPATGTGTGTTTAGTSTSSSTSSSLLASMSMSAKSLSSSSSSSSSSVLAEHRSKVGPVSTVGKKYAYCGLPYATPQQSASVQRRNARERNRVKQVNNGFANLRQHIPSTVVTALSNGTRGANKKLSKVDTLRLAVQYIRSLKRMLDETNVGEMGLTVAPSGTTKQKQQQPATSSSTVTSSTTASSTAAASATTTATTTTTTINSNQLSQQQLSNSSVCSASSGSTYYGTMSEPSIASSPAPSHMSDGSSHGGDSVTPHGCFTQISGSFKHEPYDMYVDPLNSPTPSYGSDHGIGGIGQSAQSYHHSNHHHHHHHQSSQHHHHHQQQQQQQLHLTSVAGHPATIVHDGGPTTTILPSQSATDNNNYILAAQPHQHAAHLQHQQAHHQTLQHQHQQFKTELAYDDSPYDEELSPQNPDDEELLDAISWWQQQ